MKTDTPTPAPWKMGKAGPARAIYGPAGEWIATLPGMLPDTEDRANARLIAAAPELRDAATMALEFIRGHFPLEHGNPALGQTWGALARALESATGQTVVH